MKQIFIEAGAFFTFITSHTGYYCRLGKVFWTLVLAIVGCSGFHRQITGRACNCSLFRKHHRKPYWTECYTQSQSKLILLPWRVRSVLQTDPQLRSRWEFWAGPPWNTCLCQQVSLKSLDVIAIIVYIFIKYTSKSRLNSCIEWWLEGMIDLICV